MKNYLVIDVGGTFTKFAIMNKEIIVKKGKVKTPKKTLEEFIKQLKHLHDVYGKGINGIAISFPGVIDSDKGFAYHGGALPYIKDIHIVDILQRHLKVTITVENDGKCAALGEVWKGKLKGVYNGVSIVFGTGIGGGIIVNGQLVKGEHFGAGEFSPIRTDGNQLSDYRNTLGVKGGINNLLKKAALLVDENLENFDGQKLLTAIRTGNTEVERLFFEYCSFIIGQINNLQMILDPECFVIGGGISEDPLLISTLEKALSLFYSNDPLSEITGQHINLLRSDLGNDANLWGALYHYLKKER